jgi:predicted dehydrogenase
MGMHHVRAVKDLMNAKLTAVADVRHEHAEQVAKDFQCAGYADASHLIGAVDVAIIATPPEHHAAAAVPLLGVGIPCLIEKPLALNGQDCRAIMTAAKAGSAVVAVGHVERFNPAAETLLAQGLSSAAITSIDVKRFSPAAGRQVPVDVVSDMMIHDLDVVLALKTDDVTHVEATGVPMDHATAVLTFADGTKATIATNRKADTRVRSLDVVAAAATYHLDFMARTVAKKAANAAATNVLPVEQHDALRAEIADFLSAVRTKRPPRVTPEHALKTMHVAWRILSAMGHPAGQP